jgi:hypothetical protein
MNEPQAGYGGSTTAADQDADGVVWLHLGLLVAALLRAERVRRVPVLGGRVEPVLLLRGWMGGLMSNTTLQIVRERERLALA